jgi:hypothetical protein
MHAQDCVVLLCAHTGTAGPWSDEFSQRCYSQPASQHQRVLRFASPSSRLGCPAKGEATPHRNQHYFALLCFALLCLARDLIIIDCEFTSSASTTSDTEQKDSLSAKWQINPSYTTLSTARNA